MRVLIAEDEPLILKHLESLLGQAGVSVVSSHRNGVEALEWLQAHPGAVDAMFLDVRMPGGLNGLELAAMLPNVPAIIITAFANDHVFQAFEVGVLDYLPKPLDLLKVKRAVDRLEKLTGLGLQPPSISVRKVDGTELQLSLADVDRIEIHDRRTTVYCQGEGFLAPGFRSRNEVAKAFPMVQFLTDERNGLVPSMLRPEER